MSTFEVLVRTVDGVADHPDADRLSIVRIKGYECVTAKEADGSHRFSVGELVVYVPEAAVIPEDVLKERGFFDHEKQKGMLAGKSGDRLKAVRLRGVLSQGLPFKLVNGSILTRGDISMPVVVGQDVAEIFGITKYEPVVPAGMGGDVAAAPEFSLGYDIENDKNFPGFLDNDEVEATEKLHGTNFRVTYHLTATHPDIFGGDVAVASKGSGSKGLVFKNSRENLGPLWPMRPEDYAQDKREARRWKFFRWVNRFTKWTGYKVSPPRTYNKMNLYVQIAVEQNLIDSVREYGRKLGKRIDLFGEIFGAGVQDLHYGTTKPDFRAFDIAVGGMFLGADEKIAAFKELGVERVPVLYRGPFDRAVLEKLRDGKTTLGGKNIREGIVVTATGDQTRRDTPQGTRLRPFLKMVSPDYLLRKGEVTEFQ